MMPVFEQSDTSVNGLPRPGSRPSLPRSNSTPSWPKNASMESLRSPHAIQSSTVAAPSLKKRHSTYVLSTPPNNDRAKTPVPVPVPGIPPKRPLRNPARVAPATQLPVTKYKSRSSIGSRPSTATSAREDITPWEFAPGPVQDEPPQMSPVASTSSSPVSTRPRQSTMTGSLSEVTPWDMYPVRRSATSRSSLTSGLVEEVTPWEMHPVPTIIPSRSTLATGPVEDVTPWELDPTPPPSSAPLPISEKRSSARVSTSGQGKSLSDIAHLRRRKSTSAKPLKTRSAFFGSSSYTPGDPSGSGVSAEGIKSSSAHPAPKFTHATSSRSPLPPLTPLPTTTAHDRSSTSSRTDLKFSTLDRTIFEELKRNLRARDAQFVMKGEGSSLGPVLGRRGKKHHAFPKEEVPYPRSYEREVIDADVWETAFCQDICESLTWHVFETPPTKVLDLGCGTGTWILNCARTWKNCYFVGLDIVPLQPDLQQVGSSDLASRITWVHANFLENLPFPNDEFDFVHIKRIALGVPENQWYPLFEEILRVMKPGGAFEMLEEDLFFPGKVMDSDDELETETDMDHTSLLSSHRNSSQSHSDINLGSQVDGDLLSFSDETSPTPTTAAFPVTPSRSNSPVAKISVNEDMEKEEARELLAEVIGNFPSPAEESSGGHVALNDTLSPATIRGHLELKVPKSGFTGSAVSLMLSSVGGTAPPDSDSLTDLKVPPTRRRGYSLTASLSVPESQRGRSSSASTVPEGPPNVPSLPLLLRTIPKPPVNPRDHSLLEAIWIRMLESRFINNSPLALLANYVGLYFKDVRTHPPLQYRFPATQHRDRCSDHDREEEGAYSDEGNNSDSDDARDAIVPSPVSRTLGKKPSRRTSSQNYEEEPAPISENNRYVGVRGLLKHSTPYITLDESRASAISPLMKGMFPDVSSATIQRGSFLPNTTMHFDLKTLNMHLALRAAEIVACAESMWEWVQWYKAEGYPAEVETRKRRTATSIRHRSGSESLEMAPRRSTASTQSIKDSYDPVANAIVELTREEFDGYVNWFDMDMQDKCALGIALKNTLNDTSNNGPNDRLKWIVNELPVSQEREIFDSACEKWDQWEREQLIAATHSYTSSHHSPRHRLSGSSARHSSTILISPEGSSLALGRPDSQKRASMSSSSLVPPTRRMSRAMRVFVAWKP